MGSNKIFDIEVSARLFNVAYTAGLATDKKLFIEAVKNRSLEEQPHAGPAMMNEARDVVAKLEGLYRDHEIFGYKVPKKLYDMAEQAGALKSRTAFRKAVKEGLFKRSHKEIEGQAEIISQWIRPRRKLTEKQLSRLNSDEDQRPLVRQLLRNIKKRMPKLEELYKEATGHWVYEDAVYRYYHGSFKVYHVQGMTKKIVETLKALQPKCELNEGFRTIISEGTGKVFNLSHNRNWDKHTRPILEAFFHAKFMLEMMLKYGAELKKAPSLISSGWGGVLYLYGLR